MKSLVFLATLSVALLANSVGFAQKPADGKAAEKDAAKSAAQPKKPAEPKITGRLPAYYSTIVTEAQRKQIYQIQAKHDVTIEALKAALREAVEKRNAEVESVLSDEQKKQLAELIEKSRADRKKAAAAKAAESGPAKKPEKKTATTASTDEKR
jgi:hypothetical protein